MLYSFRTHPHNPSGAATTRFGNFLAATRLDRLPQLWNVLRQDMALIGPRPERPEFATVLTAEIPFYSYRFILKPGLVGWEQFQAKKSSVRDSVACLEFDLYYLKNFSTQLDFFILFHSIKIILAGS